MNPLWRAINSFQHLRSSSYITGDAVRQLPTATFASAPRHHPFPEPSTIPKWLQTQIDRLLISTSLSAINPSDELFSRFTAILSPRRPRTFVSVVCFSIVTPTLNRIASRRFVHRRKGRRAVGKAVALSRKRLPPSDQIVSEDHTSKTTPSRTFLSIGS